MAQEDLDPRAPAKLLAGCRTRWSSAPPFGEAWTTARGQFLDIAHDVDASAPPAPARQRAAAGCSKMPTDALPAAT